MWEKRPVCWVLHGQNSLVSLLSAYIFPEDLQFSSIGLTEPRRALQPKGTQWFPWIGLFVVHAISLGPCRRPIEFLTSSHPCGCLSKIPNGQIHKVEKWKFLSHFRLKDFFVISHEDKDRFFEVIWPIKTPGHIKYWPRIDPTKVWHF